MLLFCPLVNDKTKTEVCKYQYCGWWDKHNEQCSICTIADSLNVIKLFKMDVVTNLATHGRSDE